MSYSEAGAFANSKIKGKSPNTTTIAIARNDNNLVKFSSGIEFKKTSCSLLKELCALVSSLPSLPSNILFNCMS